MRVGIDARLYGPKNRGLGRYVQQLITHLEKVDQNNQYFIFLTKKNFDEYQPTNSNFTKVLADVRWYTLKEQIVMPKIIKKLKLDLMHFPHFNVPINCPVKFIVTIHDLIIHHFPDSRATTLNPILYKIKLEAYKFVIKQAILKSQKIVAVSEFTKKDILQHYKVKADKIKVVYQGLNQKNLNINQSQIDEILKKYKIQTPYLLYVGAAYPHKNLEILIKAFDKISAKHQNLNLVLVGQKDYFYQRLQKYIQIDFPKLKNKIIFTGFVSDSELSCLYKAGLIYVFPSLFEGFGLPPLEAMQYDLPVASSQASCLPEVLKDAVIYFDPVEKNDIIKQLDILIQDADLQRQLKINGQKLLSQYNWLKATQQIVEIYNSINNAS
ncbi:MAG: glycosyltransferase family 1 protein [Patescibacteria group bacterium]|jgi:glycosyltransferase involved in cell wall biosynthesis|nr:glycosyltransferase family 1 protein [Patescibacteria group bacterium]